MSCYYCGDIRIGCQWCKTPVQKKASDTIPSPNGTVASNKTAPANKPKKIKFYGFYSQKAVNLGYPTYAYRHVDGGTVEVSWIDSDPDVNKALANWDDAEYLGEVTELIKRQT